MQCHQQATSHRCQISFEMPFLQLSYPSTTNTPKMTQFLCLYMPYLWINGSARKQNNLSVCLYISVCGGRRRGMCALGVHLLLPAYYLYFNASLDAVFKCLYMIASTAILCTNYLFIGSLFVIMIGSQN